MIHARKKIDTNLIEGEPQKAYVRLYDCLPTRRNSETLIPTANNNRVLIPLKP